VTHDELLDKIYWYWRHQDTQYFGLSGYRNALRAVVELHKPFETTPPWEYVKYMACDACESWTNAGEYNLPYPCPTIQAIEKELG
jgi:hypothetical protein